MKKINKTLQSIYLTLASILLSNALFSQSNMLAPHTQQAFPSVTATRVNANNIVLPVHTGSFPITTAGNHCASDQVMDAYLEASGLKAQFQAQYEQMLHEIDYSPVMDKANYTIPVIFHVIYSNASENVSNALIQSVFNELNEDYQLLNADAGNARSAYGFTPANINIDFCLAVRDPSNNPLSEPGVHRVSTAKTYFDPDTESNDMKYVATGGTPIWDRTRYLNVWICDITNGASSGVAGYAYSPTTSSLPPSDIDGIVIDYNLGMNNPHVLSHETGHFLGLPHTWGNSNNPTSCTGAGDGIGDTPMTIGPSFNYAGSCSGFQETCTGTQTQYENFMDYSNCTCMFTAGQSSLMNTIISGIRNSLATSNACTPVSPTPPVADFVADITTVISGGVVNFTDLSTNYPNAWSWAITPGTGWSYVGSTSSTSQNPKVQFVTPGTYTVALTASNVNGPNTKTKTNYITVVAGGGGSSACDTLRNWLVTDNPTAYINGNGSDASWGYLCGNASLDYNGDGSLMLNYLEYAEPFTASSASQVRATRLAVAQVNDNSGTGTVTFRVHSDSSSFPGPVLASETVSLSSLNAGYWNTIQFTTPASVSGNFWIGYTLSYGSPQDTLVAYIAQDRGAAPTTTKVNIDLAGWNDLGTIYSFFTSVYMDALLSNGPSPTASMYISDTVTCVGSPINMNAYGSSDATSYEWYFYDGTTLTSDTSGAISKSFTAGTWLVELNALGSCVSDFIDTIVHVNPAITPNITTTPENCTAQDGSITAAPSGGDGNTYSVSINNGVSYDNTPAYVFNSLSSGTYTTIITDGTACKDTITVTVNNVNTFNPTVSPGTTVNINQGSSTTLTVTGGTTWSWYDGASLIGTGNSITVSPMDTTVYTVSVTNSSGCTKNINITVNVNAVTPIAHFTADTMTLCVGGTVNFTDTSEHYPTSWAWSISPGTGWSYVSSTNANSENPSVQFNTSGNYTVSLTATNTAGSDVETKTTYITVNAIPSITSTTPASRCGSGTVMLGATASSGTISWYANATGGSALGTGTSYTTSTISSTTTYYVESNNGGCSTPTRTAVVATINTLPSITAGTATNPSTCGNTDGSIQVNGSGTGDVSWTGTASGSATGVSLPYTITGLGAGSYSITFTNGSGCTSSVLNQSLSDPSAPTTPTITAGGPTTFCTGGSVTLTSSASTGNTWSTGATSQSITVSTSGSYSVTVGTGCTATSLATTVTVNSNPSTPTITATGSTTFCSGGSVMLTASSPSDNVWSNGATTQSITVSTSGTYTVTTGTACTATSAGTTVTVNANPSAPTITPGSSTTFCAGDSVVLTSSQGSGNVWSTGASTQSVAVYSSGSYSVTYTDGNGCSATSLATPVTVNAIPTIISTTPGSRCDTGTVALGASASAGTIAWYDAPTGGTLLGNGSSFTTPVIGSSTTYYVETTNNGCTSARTAVVATIVGGTTSTQTVSVCSGANYTYPDGTVSNNITATETHTSTLTASGGCDSTIVTTVNVSTVNTTVFTSGITLNAVQNGAQYVWINCATSGAIPGATNQSYTATANGSYAVIVTDNGCSDTSACTAITTLSVDEYSLNDGISLYPNPSLGKVSLAISFNKAQNLKVRVYSLVGSLILEQDYTNVSSATYPIDLSDKENGAYLVRIIGEKETVTKRIVIAK